MSSLWLRQVVVKQMDYPKRAPTYLSFGYTRKKGAANAHTVNHMYIDRMHNDYSQYKYVQFTPCWPVLPCRCKPDAVKGFKTTFRN